MKSLIDIDEETYKRFIREFETFPASVIPQSTECTNNILDKIIVELEELKNMGSYDEHLFYYNYGLNTAIKIINIYKNKESNNDTIH